MKFSIGTNWDRELLNGLRHINKFNAKNKIVELFGSLRTSILGSARYSTLKDNNEIELVSKITGEIKKAGFELNYLLNASICPNLHDKYIFQEIINYISWIKELGICMVTVTEPALIKFLLDYFPDLKVKVSLVLGIETVDVLRRIKINFPNVYKVALHESVNRNKLLLHHLISTAHKKTKYEKSIEVELWANTSCLYKCKLRKEHYRYVSSLSQNIKCRPFQQTCYGLIHKNPLEILNMPFIRPEDVKIYEKMGIDYIKLSGRDLSTDFLLNIAKAYIRGEYKGNFLDLLDKNLSSQYYIDNSKLDGLLRHFLKKNIKDKRQN